MSIIEEDLTASDSANHLRHSMAAVRLSFTWFGVRKTLTPDQRSQAAGSFGAHGEYVSAAKKLIDTTHPAFKAVTAIKTQAIAYWKGMSLPFPEPGIRLIRHDDLSEFDRKIISFQEQLSDAVDNLNEHFFELRMAAQERLGELFDQNDYPESLTGLFSMTKEYPAVEPPDYLRQLNPSLYQAECEKVQRRFDEALRMAETMFGEELLKLVQHLKERLQDDSNGKPKIFRDSAVENLTQFFKRFQQLSIGSCPELDAIVSEASSILAGYDANDLRTQEATRQLVAREMESLEIALDQHLIDRPRRRIQRRVV